MGVSRPGPPGASAPAAVAPHRPASLPVTTCGPAGSAGSGCCQCASCTGSSRGSSPVCRVCSDKRDRGLGCDDALCPSCVRSSQSGGCGRPGRPHTEAGVELTSHLVPGVPAGSDQAWAGQGTAFRGVLGPRTPGRRCSPTRRPALRWRARGPRGGLGVARAAHRGRQSGFWKESLGDAACWRLGRVLLWFRKPPGPSPVTWSSGSRDHVCPCVVLAQGVPASVAKRGCPYGAERSLKSSGLDLDCPSESKQQ